MSRKSIGNSAEIYVAEHLSKKGWFVVLVPQGVSGQPFDLIAIRNNRCLCGDVKHISRGDVFPISRVEPNQITAFELLRLTGTSEYGIFLKFEGDNDVYFQYWEVMKNMKSISKWECRKI